MPKTITVSDETYAKIQPQLEEDEQETITDLNKLVGKTFTFWCARYIYHGEVEAVSALFITLKNASVVYETGELSAKEPVDMQALPKGTHVMWSAVESFGGMKW